MHFYNTRPVVVDPATVRALSTVVPCPQCDDRGLCLRCWRVAAVAVELTIAARVEQCVDDAWGVAA